MYKYVQQRIYHLQGPGRGRASSSPGATEPGTKEDTKVAGQAQGWQLGPAGSPITRPAHNEEAGLR